MKLKVDKEQFISDVYNDVNYAVEASFRARQPSYYGEEVKIDINSMIRTAVAEGITIAMRRLIDSQYTVEDFENDMGLKD